jgi:quinol monooxygenase YgiN
MVLYEVEIRLDPTIEAEWLDWIPGHAARLLALPGFRSAELYRAEDESPPLYRVCYRLSDPAALQEYLTRHAPRLRAEGEARFGGRFQARRRIFHLERRLTPVPDGGGETS